MSKLKYLDHIDSLRALAVLLVLFFHLDIHLFKGGFLGVDVFFVISGFLITRNISYEYQNTHRFNFTRFYYRRVKRLLPSFLLATVFTFLLGFLILSPSGLIELTDSMFMGSVALSNFYFLGESGYFDTAAKLKPLLHTWSLSVEEQYYFVWPLTLILILKVFRKYKKSLLILFLTILAVGFTFYINTTGVSPKVLDFFSHHKESPVDLLSFLFFLLPFRTYEFLIGALLVFAPAIPIKNEKGKFLLAIFGFLMILLPATTFDENLTYLSVLNIIPCIGIGILINAPTSKYFNRFFYNTFIRQIGNASYTIYLFHWPVIVFYKLLFDKPIEFLSGIILFTLSIVLSLFVYKYYETPFRHNTWKTHWLEYSKMGFIMFTFVLGSWFIKTDVMKNQGWIWRLDEKNLELVEEIGVPIKYHYANWGGANYKFESILENNRRPKQSLDMVWLGDSHSGHYAAGIDSVLVKKHGSKVEISYVSCFVLPDIISTNEKCTLDADSVLNSKIKLLEDNPDAVMVLSYYWRLRLFSTCEIPDDASGEAIDLSDKQNAYYAMCEKIEKLHSMLGNERKIIVIGESPTRIGGLNYIDKLLKPGYLAFISPVSSTFTLDQSLVEINDFMSAYFKDKKNLVFIDPTQAFCEDGTCLSQFNTKIYFSDVDHLSKVGSVHVMEYFEDKFLQIMTPDTKTR
ncbi:MAG: acyltransferase [Bacteroidales bacterium]|nr:acyltransferase [Bacteroidales bacterium]